MNIRRKELQEENLKNMTETKGDLKTYPGLG
jgi:hypothetical protein